MAASRAPWLSSRVGDEEAFIDGLVENLCEGSAVVVDGGRGKAPFSLIAASQHRTAGVVICFNVSSPNSGSTRARSSASVLVAVVSPTVDRLYPIHSSA